MNRTIAAKRDALHKLREQWRAKQKAFKAGDCDQETLDKHRDAFVVGCEELETLEKQVAADERAEALSGRIDRPAPGARLQYHGGADPNRIDGPEGGISLAELPPDEATGATAFEIYMSLGVDQTAKHFGFGIASEERQSLERFAAAHNRVTNCYILHGMSMKTQELLSKIGDMERHSLVTFDEEKGGVLISPDRRTELLKDLAGLSIMRTVARVEETEGDLYFPTLKSATTETHSRTTDFVGEWTGDESKEGIASQDLFFGEEKIETHEWMGRKIKGSERLLRNRRANVDRILSEVIMEAFAIDEELAFWTGNGSGKPEGVTQTTGIRTQASLVSAGIGYAGIVRTKYSTPAQYHGISNWFMRGLTYAAILELEDTAGNPIVPPNSEPDTLLGQKVRMVEYLAAIAANAKCALYGAMRIAYIIADGAGLRIRRYDQDDIPKITYLPTAEIGGQVVRPHPLTWLVCDA